MDIIEITIFRKEEGVKKPINQLIVEVAETLINQCDLDINGLRLLECKRYPDKIILKYEVIKIQLIFRYVLS